MRADDIAASIYNIILDGDDDSDDAVRARTNIAAIIRRHYPEPNGDARARCEAAAKAIHERFNIAPAYQASIDTVDLIASYTGIAEVMAERDRFEKVIAEMLDGLDCAPDCDGVMHGDECPVANYAAAFLKIRRERDEAVALVKRLSDTCIGDEYLTQDTESFLARVKGGGG